MSPTPVNRGSPWPSAAAAAQTEWYIGGGSDSADGYVSSPLATYGQLVTRVGAQRLLAPTVVWIVNGLADGDVITALAVGPYGRLTVQGVPQTPVTTATLTAVTPASGNTPASLAAAISWGSYLGYRVLAASGASTGASTWIGRSLGGGVVQFAAAINLDPMGYGVATLTVGDDIAVESLAQVVPCVFPFPVAGPAPIDTCPARIVFKDLDFSLDPRPMHVPNMGSVSDVLFLGCKMGQISGTFTAVGCSFPPGTVFDSGEQVLRGCVLHGSPTIGRGAVADWGGNTLVSAGSGMHVAGSLTVTSDVRICDSSGIGLTVDIGGTVVCSPSAAIRGAGHTGIGLWIMPGARLYYDLATGGLPKITGTGGDIKIAGTQLGYNSILYGQPDAVSIDGAILARYGTTAYAIPLATPFTADVTMFGIAAGAEVVGCIATLPINGPSLTVPANGNGQGFVCKFLQPWTAAGSSFDIIVEWWVGTSLYFGVCGVTRDTDGAEGQHFSIGSSSTYTFVAGIGGDLRVRIINNGVSALPPITTIIWT